MTDDRVLSTDYRLEDSPFYVLTAAVNYLFAQQHYYDFLYVQVDSDVKDVINDQHDILSDFSRDKVGINRVKAGVISYIINSLTASNLTIGTVDLSKYDSIIILDSRIYFNPNFWKQSISDFIAIWSSRSLKNRSLVRMTSAPIVVLHEARALLINVRNISSLTHWWKNGNSSSIWKLISDANMNDKSDTSIVFIDAEPFSWFPCTSWICEYSVMRGVDRSRFKATKDIRVAEDIIRQSLFSHLSANSEVSSVHYMMALIFLAH